MTDREAVKSLIRIISAIVIATVITWIFARVYVIDIEILHTPSITASQAITLILSFVLVGLILELQPPLNLIYKESLGEKSVIAGQITQQLLRIVCLATLYIFIKPIAINILILGLPQHTSNIIYDAIFIVIILLIVYNIIKILTR